MRTIVDGERKSKVINGDGEFRSKPSRRSEASRREWIWCSANSGLTNSLHFDKTFDPNKHLHFEIDIDQFLASS